MKRIFCLLLSVLLWLLGSAQEFQYFATKDGVDISSRYGDDLLTLKFTNKRNEKVYVSLDKVVWKQGEVTVDEDKSGGGLTLSPQETSSFGMYFAYPKGYNSQNYQSLHFVLIGLKVEIGGMGKDPRYQKASGTSTNSRVTGGQGLPEIDFSRGASREPGSNEWKPLPPQNVISFPTDEKNTGQNSNTAQPSSSNNSKPADANIKLNGIYYSNGTVSQVNTNSSNNSTYNNQVQQTRNEVEQRFASNKSNKDLATSISELATAISNQSGAKRQREAEYEAERRQWHAEYLAEKAEEKRKFEDAKARTVEELTSKSLNGDNLAMFQLGIYYGIEKDKVEELAWLTQAAEKGNGLAMGHLGSLYSQAGSLAHRWDSASVYWYEKGALLNDPYSLYELGMLYYGKRSDLTYCRKSLVNLLKLASLDYKMYDENDAFVMDFNGKIFRNGGREMFDTYVSRIQTTIGWLYLSLIDLEGEEHKKANQENALIWFKKSIDSFDDYLTNPKLDNYNQKRIKKEKSWSMDKIKQLEKELKEKQ